MDIHRSDGTWNRVYLAGSLVAALVGCDRGLSVEVEVYRPPESEAETPEVICGARETVERMVKEFGINGGEIGYWCYHLNADGRSDLVIIADTENDTHIYTSIGNGKGCYSRPREVFHIGPNDSATNVDFYDVNKDNITDMVITSDTAPDPKVAFGNGDGTFQKPVPLSIYKDGFEI